MRFVLFASLLTSLLFLGLIVMQELGRWFGRRWRQRTGQEKLDGFGAIESSVFALLGLLTAFSFDGAASRFEHRRILVTEEVNAIGTAYRRLGLLPTGTREPLQEKFRLYVRERLRTYRVLPDVDAAKASIVRSEQIQDEIWADALAALSSTSEKIGILLLPPINQMFDQASTRLLAMQDHPPKVVFGMLGGLALLSAFVAGFGMATLPLRPVVHVLVFAATLAIAVYVIIDLEYPLVGMIRVNDADQNMSHVLDQMK
jgi:hypothetical protein